MKKNIFGFLALVFCLNLIPSTVIASPLIFLPEQVLFGTSATYSAGQVENMTFVDSTQSSGKRQNIEYGIAQTFTEGLITSYEIITTKEADISGFDAIPGLTVEIPNVIASQGTSSPKTYVAYIKFLEKNNQDNASFYASKEFSITPNNTPYTTVKNVNLLMSNGDRFFTIHGPSIYIPEEAAADQNISSSTSLEITFESNVETVLNPKIIFTKLRSNSFKEEFVPAPITIKKGLNYIVIPLPVFGYEPGVYTGQMVIDSKTLKNTVDLQYIVSGESVTVGSPVLVTKDSKEHISFDIFSTPIDLDREADLVNTSALPTASSTSTPVLYSTTIELLDKDKNVLSTITQDVDFMQERFSVEIPVAKFKKLDIEYTHIKVTSPRTGKVVYEGTKDFTYSSLPEINLYEIGFVVLYILFLIAVLFFAFKRDLKKAIAFGVLIGILFISKSAFGVVTQGLYPLDSTVVNKQATASQLLNVTKNPDEHYPKFYFQDDVVNKTYTCGMPKTITFTVRYIMCSNATPILKVGASMSDLNAAEAAKSDIGLASAQEGVGSVGVHSYYRRLSEFRTATVPASQSGTQYLYLYVYHKASAATNEIYRGYSYNAVPVTTGSCSACTNAPETSNVPNFKVHGRNYYYSSIDQKLYYREAPAGANMSTPDACGIDLCADTSDIETDFPAGKVWSPQPPTNSTDPNRYACVGMSITCACQGRNRVCTNSTMGTTSTDINHSSCLLRAYCSVSYFGTNSGTVTFDAYNKLGSLAFDPDENPVIRESIAIGNELITRNVIDTFDGRDAEASCLLEYGGGILHGNTGSSTIIKFYADPKVVDSGRMCHFGWQTNNMESCSINSVNYATNTFPGDPESYSVGTLGERNRTVTLSCYGVVDPDIGGPAPLIATTTTCFVNPKIQEN
ncbi:MAG: hypothetical protein V4686_02815 [Patescibacteria group bacterium]